MTDDQTSTSRSKSVLENLTIAVTALATALFLGGCAAATNTAHQQASTHTTTSTVGATDTDADPGQTTEVAEEPRPIFVTPIHAEPHRDSPVVGEIADPNCFDLDPSGNPTPAPVEPDIYGGLWHQTDAGWVLNTGFCT